MVFFMHSKMISLRLNLLLGLLIGLTFSVYGQTNCIIISRDTEVIDGDNYLPGDTLCIESGQGEFLLFRNIHGDANNPIVIINSGGQVEIITPHFYGIKFQNCSFIKLSGKGDQAHNYGIYISFVQNGAGITIDNLSTNIEIENIEISNIPIAGIYAKTEPFQGDCENLITRENFTMYNIKIHDCYLHDIGDEGFYIGSSKYTGQTVYNCNDTVVLPHVIDGVEIYNNIIENTGWDGIQVSSAVSECYIYGNTIRYDSDRETQNQMSGILIGGGSNCDCFNNKIFDGKGDGIDILGLGNHKIYNNLIVRAGEAYHPNDAPTSFQKHGIWVGDVATTANSELLIYSNTIISPRTYGFKLTNTNIAAYKIYNNIIVDPGSYSLLGNNSFVNKSDEIISYFSLNNLFKQQLSEVQFLNTITNNFDLKTTSPAYNSGTDLSSLELFTDIDDRPRPFGGYYDIGAYESQETINGIRDLPQPNKTSPLQKIAPNPLSGSGNIKYELFKTSEVKLYLVNGLGKIVHFFVNEIQNQNTYKIELSKEMFGTGFYYVVLECNLGRFTEKLVII